MNEIRVSLDRACGKIKPMHAVNNGPVYKFAADQRITNIDYFREAGIPYARNHDAAFCSTYGGEHSVDVANIFTNFDADPEDPASYDFAMTDEYLRVIDYAGVKTYYRLGHKIEHGIKKYGTLPPRDFKKWAVICEHIIRHYTEGWANGFHYDIEYWEIWNEPDLDPDDSTHKRCWGGTEKEFFELYDIAATHLKRCFPHLKIGGPALAHRMDWAERFLAQLKAPLDFFSWHSYSATPEAIAERTRAVRALLDKHGCEKTESILNEWNFVKGWEGDTWIYSLKCEKNMVGAAFVAATMTLEQREALDMLMYYDARPCGMNGMFKTDNVSECLKGYYPFKAFNELYKLGEEVEATASEGYYALAAEKDGNAAIMMTRFAESGECEKARVEFSGLNAGAPVKVEYYRLDDAHDLTLVREDIFAAASFATYLDFEYSSMYLIKIMRV